jgi:anti-sigma B factor antagonist
MPLEIQETKEGPVVVLTLQGTLEIGKDTERLQEIVQGHLQNGDILFLLDLAGVRYIDSSGITALIKIHTASKNAGGAMKLLRLTQRVHDVLQITRLSSVFEIYNDPAKAMSSFAAGGNEKKLRS